MGYKLKSRLSEDQIESDVASYLGYITPFWSKRFQLKSVNEQLTGADKLFERFVPIYLQFKVSEGLKPLQFGIPFTRSKFPLQRIRRFRRQNNLDDNPTLYFRLRKMAKHATDYQHNILLSFHNPPNQYALYVAPLSLNIDEYNSSLEVSMIKRYFIRNPFSFLGRVIHTGTSNFPLGLIPFLRGHISIPPDTKVTTSEHYYSFSKSGSDIAWHSGDKIEGDYRLSTKISEIYNSCLNYKEIGYNKESYANYIKKYLKENMDLERINRYDSQENLVYNFANYLKIEYNIKLMLLWIRDND